ncbi:hypothetical protein Halhy_4031 [Haliscomenobacter hydrossis DSM 1100]|uniref:Uncharacterized protein n=1 Tax=Haliscomenobacter hydrossis (strain ATCC 27775 / DSM 1100 / LMG 10767 / O) TaxID=760192 RepID=F4L5P4_HALH1|nr:hypothetical protein Halhy_4031 [Haliscomenobacter hydrossis DSM 1100]
MRKTGKKPYAKQTTYQIGDHVKNIELTAMKEGLLHEFNTNPVDSAQNDWHQRLPKTVVQQEGK